MLDEGKLRSIGFNDPNVIQHILSDPEENRKYTSELGLVADAKGNFAFDFPNEINKAYSDLGAYYDKLLKDSNDDLNLALSRLTEDYDTGKRFSSENTQLSRESLKLAADDLARDSERARTVARDSLINRGLYRTSQFAQNNPNMGIATQTLQDVEGNILNAQAKQGLAERGLELGAEQDSILLDRNRQRAEEDVRKETVRYSESLGEERKQRAEQLAAQRQARAYSRFESGLF